MLSLLVPVLLAFAAPRPEAVVVRTVENMYSAPGADKDVVSQACLGQVVGIVERKAGFVKIETADAYQGWVPAAALLEYPGPRAPRYASKGEALEVVTLMANVYRDPSATSARPKTQAPMGARLEPAGPAVSERWLRVRLPDGDTGYVQAGDVKRVDVSVPRPRGSGADVVSTARRFTGVPYLWGGMTARGLDCSGLTSLAYRVNGVELRRDADLQFADSRLEAVDKADLRPGDLVFFGKDKDKISHVGIYLDDGRFISATVHQAPVVQESSLDEPHWAERYQGARRPR